MPDRHGLTRMLIVAIALVSLGAPVAADESPPAALRKAEASARSRVAKDLVTLAKFSTSAKAYDAAREDLGRAVQIAPDLGDAKKRLAALPDKPSDPRRGFEKSLASKRKRTYRLSAKRLGDVAKKLHKAGFASHYESLAALVAGHFGTDAVKSSFGAVWSDLMRAWVHASDAKRIRAGEVHHGGAWLSKREQAELNAKHRTWDAPWVLDDGVHQLRTTLPLRDAQHLLGHIGAFRRMLLASVAGEWDLRPPSGLLPVVVTETQADLQAQMAKATRGLGGGGGGPQQGAAFYLQSNSALNPCFVTLEPNTMNSGARRVKVEEIYLPMQHELTHQIAFEYSKYDYDQTRGIRYQFWCVEAVANLYEYYVIADGTWRLSRPSKIPMGAGYIEGAFAFTKKNIDRLPSLETLFGYSQREFSTIENYHMSAAVAHFLLHGQDGRYRRAFLRLLATVHRVRETSDTFATCFEGVGAATLQKEWVAYARRIEVDD